MNLGRIGLVPPALANILSANAPYDDPHMLLGGKIPPSAQAKLPGHREQSVLQFPNTSPAKPS